MALGFNHNIDQHQAPSLFARGPSAFARLVFFTALSLALIVTDSRLQYLTEVRKYLITALHPLQVIANTPANLYSDATEYFSTHARLLTENTALKQQALEQGVALQKLNSLAAENNHLRQLLQANQSMKEQSVLAEVVHVGRDVFTKEIIVNRGEKHSIAAGEAVVDANGVIGQVTRVSPLTSEVTLITSKSLAIPVQIERNGLRAIALGRGRDNTLDLPYLPTNVDIKRGDRLVTSGIDGVYPAGLSVATVTQVDITPDSPFARIICTPTGGTENFKQVLLVQIPQNAVQLSNALAEQSTPTDTASSNAQSATQTSQPTKPNHATQASQANAIKSGQHHASE
jgi:rod shape-determining protein MreC